MTDGDQDTHAALAEELKASIGRLREDVEARSDPVLGEIAHALQLLLDLSAHTHHHAIENRSGLGHVEDHG